MIGISPDLRTNVFSPDTLTRREKQFSGSTKEVLDKKP